MTVALEVGRTGRMESRIEEKRFEVCGDVLFF